MVHTLKYLACLLLACLLGCQSGTQPAAAGTADTAPASQPATPTVLIDNFTFNPPVLTVPAGTRITWINRDDVPHTVTSSTDPKVMQSGVLDTDGRYAVTFTTPGTYPYYCKVHAHMTGTVIVK